LWWLNVAVVPGVPKSVTIDTLTPTTVDFIIELPENDGGVPVHGYHIEYGLSINERVGRCLLVLFFTSHIVRRKHNNKVDRLLGCNIFPQVV
jgi:hypothetical protein